jgi:hypothetical protein
MFRQFRCMATGRGPTALGTVSDVEQSQVMPTHHVYSLCLSGPTSARPKQGDGDMPGGTVPLGVWYLDTTLNAVVVSDSNAGWRNPVTGALV